MGINDKEGAGAITKRGKVTKCWANCKSIRI